jgi:flagellin FlaB
MIAFVIVAAALAFVVLNMGFGTTQRAKTAIISSLGESSSSLEIAGKVTGVANVAPGVLNVTNIPLKIASGGESVNLDPTLTAVAYLSNSIQYDDIYVGILQTGSYINVTWAFSALDGHTGSRLVNGSPNAVLDIINANTANGTGSNTGSSGNANATSAIIFFSVNRNDNFILDQGEHATMSIQHKVDERPSALDNLRIEILLPVGAPLTIERQVPNLTNLVTDLG